MWFPGPETSRRFEVGPVAAPPLARLHRRDAPDSPRGRCPRDLRGVLHGLIVDGAGLMPVLRHWFFRFRTWLASSRCLATSVCRHARWVSMLYCWLVHSPARLPLLVVVLLSAVAVPPLSPWLPPWAPRVMAGLAVRAAWLRRPSVAPPLERGLPTRAAVRAGFPGLRTAGRQAGRWCVPGLGSGPGSGPGDQEMTVLWAVPPARMAGLGAAGTPVRLVPGPAGGLPGLLCWASPERGDWGSRWGCGRGGARCRRAGCLWCWSG